MPKPPAAGRADSVKAATQERLWASYGRNSQRQADKRVSCGQENAEWKDWISLRGESASEEKPLKFTVKARAGRAKVKAATSEDHSYLSASTGAVKSPASAPPTLRLLAAAAEASSEDEVAVTGVGKKRRADTVPDTPVEERCSHTGAALVYWKGSEGDTHIVLASDIAQLIKEANTQVDRTPAAIVAKIKALEKSFREANDFRMVTGEGILGKASAEESYDAERKMKQAETTVEVG
ncbi:hypothetical protein V8E36_007374 [Tilletia maclaganii]